MGKLLEHQKITIYQFSRGALPLCMYAVIFSAEFGGATGTLASTHSQACGTHGEECIAQH